LQVDRDHAVEQKLSCVGDVAEYFLDTLDIHQTATDDDDVIPPTQAIE
jgi:hypothetical protein